MKLSFVATLVAAATAFSVQAKEPTFIYDVKGKFNQKKAESAVIKSGGKLLSCIEEIAVCQVSYDSIEMAQNSGLNIHPDVTAYAPKVEAFSGEHLSVADAGGMNPPNTGDDDFYFDLQWGHTAVGATQAWSQGITGAGVRVAVIDSGADGYHPDLSPNINVTLSRSFLDGETWDYAGADTFNHGSHTAGTIAAADNGFGTIGVAPDAELVILKSLSADTGSGSSYATMQALVYAANIGADVVNMSLGLSIQKDGKVDVNETPYDPSDDVKWYSASSVAEFVNMYAKATSYAKKNGVTLIASAGNDGLDLDHTADLLKLPADLPSVISISALGPKLWAVDSNTSLDNLAVYSNYGQSAVDFGAPGGDYASAFEAEGFDVCTVAGVTNYCYVFDFVFSTGNGGWYWSVGTSMAAPHATGVAALIISANGGDMSPVEVEREMKRLAADLGKPGKDDVYGKGRVQAPDL
jgi:subtilisin family serine protease